MTRVRPTRHFLLATGVGAGAVALTLIFTAGGLVLASQVGHVVVIAMVLFALAGVAMFFVPLDTLPAIALVTYVFIPRTVLALQDLTSVLTPSFAIMLVWAVRSFSQKQEGRFVLRVPVAGRAIGLSLFVWLVVTLLLNRVIPTSLVWMLAFSVLFLLPLFVPYTPATVRKLQSAFLGSALVLSVYCIVEFGLQSNPLQPLMQAIGIPDVQHWSVYRSYGTLGHPLYAGLFFAIAFAVALGRKLEATGRRNLLIAGLCLGGLLTTVSRNSIGAVAIAAGVMVIASLITRSNLSGITRVALGVVVAAAAAGVTQVPVFQDRFDSTEAAGSTAARDAIVTIALQAAEAQRWLGGGPGNSLILAKPFNPRETILENAYLQLLISIGIPGLILFALLILGGIVHAFRMRSFVGIGALAAYAFSIGFFNIIETSEASLVLGGLVLFLAWGAAPAHENISPPAPRLVTGTQVSARTRQA